MKIAIYPGSFDPVTLGHVDIIRRSTEIVDELIVAVLTNSAKNPLFSVEERVNMIKEITADIPKVKVESFSGLLVDFAKENDANIIVRGLRAVTDFEYELQISQMNRTIYPKVDTMFLTTSLEYAYLSSTIVKEVASYYNVEISEIKGKKRTAIIKDARNMAIYLTRKITQYSTTEIGNYFDRDHSTITHSIDKVDQERKQNSDIATALDSLENTIKSKSK